MSDMKKSGKTVLRGVDGAPAAGVCLYSIGPKGIEATISAQLPGNETTMAVFQSGPENGYACRAPEGIAGTIRCGDSAAMAVWVLSGGKPALFGQIRAGVFSAAEARRRLQETLDRKTEAKRAEIVSAAGLPASPLPANPMVKPTNREPASAEQTVPFPAANAPGRFVYPPKNTERPPGLQAKASEPLLLLQPGPQPAQKSAEPKPESRSVAAAPAGQQAKAAPPAPAPTAQTVSAAAVQPAAKPQPMAKPQPAAKPQPVAKQQPAVSVQPLLVRRAPRPTPRPPVYSPLWDDVSAEFEKMLDTLPQAHPFSGDTTDARIAEMPTGGAVQCYIGSVDIDGMKVFLQAVPARPYARPAGFDHSLVSRSGECYWVKYFIQTE